MLTDLSDVVAMQTGDFGKLLKMIFVWESRSWCMGGLRGRDERKEERIFFRGGLESASQHLM